MLCIGLLSLVAKEMQKRVFDDAEPFILSSIVYYQIRLHFCIGNIQIDKTSSPVELECLQLLAVAFYLHSVYETSQQLVA